MGGGPGMTGYKEPTQEYPQIRATLLLIPMAVLQCYRDVTLAGHGMYVNGIHFINNISRHINFMMWEHTTRAEDSTLHISIKQAKHVYMQWVLKVVKIIMDGQFECMSR